MELLKEASSLLFVAGFHDFVIIIKSKGKKISDNLHIRMYLTKANFPYLDTIDYIYKTLQMLWLFWNYKSTKGS